MRAVAVGIAPPYVCHPVRPGSGRVRAGPFACVRVEPAGRVVGRSVKVQGADADAVHGDRAVRRAAGVGIYYAAHLDRIGRRGVGVGGGGGACSRRPGGAARAGRAMFLDEAVDAGVFVPEGLHVRARRLGPGSAGRGRQFGQQAEPLAVRPLPGRRLVDRGNHICEHRVRIRQDKARSLAVARLACGDGRALRRGEHRRGRRVRVHGHDVAVQPDRVHGHDAPLGDHDGGPHRVGAPRLGPDAGGRVVVRLEPVGIGRPDVRRYVVHVVQARSGPRHVKADVRVLRAPPGQVAANVAAAVFHGERQVCGAPRVRVPGKLERARVHQREHWRRVGRLVGGGRGEDGCGCGGERRGQHACKQRAAKGREQAARPTPHSYAPLLRPCPFHPPGRGGRAGWEGEHVAACRSEG